MKKLLFCLSLGGFLSLGCSQGPNAAVEYQPVPCFPSMPKEAEENFLLTTNVPDELFVSLGQEHQLIGDFSLTIGNDLFGEVVTEIYIGKVDTSVHFENVSIQFIGKDTLFQNQTWKDSLGGIYSSFGRQLPTGIYAVKVFGKVPKTSRINRVTLTLTYSWKEYISYASATGQMIKQK